MSETAQGTLTVAAVTTDGATTSGAAKPAAKSSLEGVFPLTAAQRLHLEAGAVPVEAAPWGVARVDLAGAVPRLDAAVAELEGRFRRLVGERPLLRSSFAWKRVERPLRVVRRDVAAAVDTRRAPAGSAVEEAVRWADGEIAAAAASGGDPARPPLTRMLLLRHGPGRATAALLWHPLLLDAGTAAGLWRELLSGVDGGEQDTTETRDTAVERDAGETHWRHPLEPAGAAASFGFESVAGGGEAGDAGLHHPLTAAASAALDRLAGRGIPVAAALAGAWALLLARTAGRRSARFLFADAATPAALPPALPLPLRVDVPAAGDPGVWLAGLARELENRRARPASQPAGDGAPELSVRGFETAVVIEPGPPLQGGLTPSGFAGVEIDAPSPHTPPPAPWSLHVESGAEPALRLGHPAGEGPAATARGLARRLDHLLSSLADGDLGGIDPLSPEEAERALVTWNDTATGHPALPGRGDEGTAPVPELVARRAAERPDAPAVAAADASLTYGGLLRRADRLAAHLAALGVGRGDRVALVADRSAALLVGALAVMRAGGAYLPLDPAYPPARLRGLMVDAAAGVVLVPGRLADRLPAAGEAAGGEGAAAHVVDLDAPESWQPAAAGFAAPAPLPQQAAYVIYTSGSTGRPKGVVLTHAGLANLVAWHRGEYALDASVRASLVASPGFDACVWEIWPYLAAGAELRVPDDETRGDPQRLGKWLADQEITHSFLPTPLAEAVLAAGLPGPGTALRTLLTGGDRLRRRGPRDGGFELVNHYGPTEGTVVATRAAVGPAEAGAPPIGRPLPNTTAYVVSPEGRPLPPGVPGELWIGGAGLARGYLDRPRRTAAAFVPDPFAGISPQGRPGGRLYRTGDQVRQRPDGAIDYLGRVDEQVKLRGFRIELGEIEAVLHGHPAVRSAAVLVRESGAARHLEAWVVAGGAEPAPEEVQEWLGRRLPDHMVPSAVAFTGELPLTPHGKVDRRALAARPPVAEAAAAYAAPRGEAETGLAAIWADLLGAERVGRDDNFFHLGGDSILAIQVVSRARAAGLALAPRQIFEHQTVAALAAVAEPATEGGEAATDPGGEPVATPVQRWYLTAGPTDPHHFNQALLLTSRRPLEAGRLGAALARVLERHDALGHRFETGPGTGPSGGPRVRTGAPRRPRPVLPRVDLGALPAERRGAALEMAAARLQASLDLDAGPLLRTALLDPGDGDPRLFLVAHHLVVDAVSWHMLLDELGAAYAGDELPPPPPPFAAWGRRLARYAASPELARELPHWRGTAARTGAAARLPSAAPDAPPVTRGEASSRSVDLDAGTTAALVGEITRAYGVGVHHVLLAALAAVLGRAAGAGPGDAVHFDVEGHGRQPLPDGGPDVSRTVGWFTSIYPLALEAPPADASPPRLLTSVKEQLARVPGGGVGFGVLRWLGDDEDLTAELAAIPAADVLFNYLGRFDTAGGPGAWSLAPESPGPAVSPRQALRHRLEVSARVLGGRLRIGLTYGACDLGPVIDGLAADLESTLTAMARTCATGRVYTPSDFPLAGLDAPALDRLLAGEPEVEDMYPLSPLQEGMLLHDLAQPSSRALFEQATPMVRGDLDAGALLAAWQWVMDRHPILRTAFRWEGLPRPLQVVYRRCPMPFSHLDWSALPEAEQRLRWARLLAADRRRGLDPARAPLMRLLVVTLGEGRHALAWSQHHLLLDGWALGIVLREVSAAYAALRSGRLPGGEGAEESALAPARPFRDYVAWLEERDPAEAEAWWRRRLAGFTRATPLPGDRPLGLAEGAGGEAAGWGERQLVLDPEATSRLASAARRQRVTLGSLVHAAWGLLLARAGCGESGGEADVVFGVTVAGRPADLPGVEGIVGPFINVLPLRLELDLSAPAVEWLPRVAEAMSAMREFESSPGVQQWSEVPLGQPLFESTVAFENFPAGVEGGGGADSTGLELSEGASMLGTRYPLTLVTGPGEAMNLTLLHDRDRFTPVVADALLRALASLLHGFATAASRPLAELPLTNAPGGAPEIVELPGAGGDAAGASWRDALLAGAAREAGAIGVAVADAAGRALPRGVVGRAFLGLAADGGATCGPDRRPELRPTPFAARATAAGGVGVVGRWGEPLRRRGATFWPGDAEAVLSRVPGVAAAAVGEVPWADDGGETRSRLPLAVAWVPAAGTGGSDEAAAAEAALLAAARRLPPPARPELQVRLDEIPADAEARLDLAAIATGAVAVAGPGDASPAQPATPVEEMLLRLWCEVLGVPSVARDESFVQQGGHSLLAVRLVARIRETFGVDLPLSALFEHPTVSGLAPRIEEARRGGGNPPPELRPVSGQRREAGWEPPLSFAQQRLWFLDRLEREQAGGGGASYNVPSAVRLGPGVDPGALAAALSELVRRHEVLRTALPAGPDGPVQRLLPATPVPLPEIDLSRLGAGAGLEEAARLAAREAATPFDLARDRMLRARLLRLAGEPGPGVGEPAEPEHGLLFTLHHIASDAASVAVLSSELATLYADFSARRPGRLPELPVQYSDYAAWQREWLSGAVLRDHLEYWREALAGLPPALELPADRPRPAEPSQRGAHHRFRLEADLARRLLALAEDRGVTPFMLLLAAFQLLLGRLAGGDDVAVGVASANRPRRETESLIGFFVNMLVLRGDLSGDPTFGELLQRTRSRALGAFAHQALPFERLVEELRPERREGASPLFQVAFGLKEEVPGVSAPGFAPLLDPPATARYDLTLWMARSGDRLSGDWTYATDLYDRSTIERFSRRFQTLLERIAADPDARLSELGRAGPRRPRERARPNFQSFSRAGAGPSAQDGPGPAGSDH